MTRIDEAPDPPVLDRPWSLGLRSWSVLKSLVLGAPHNLGTRDQRLAVKPDGSTQSALRSQNFLGKVSALSALNVVFSASSLKPRTDQGLRTDEEPRTQRTKDQGPT